MFEQLNKNNVSSYGQLSKSRYVKLYNPHGEGVRVMFVGNSITLHGPKADIGWLNNCGMAASSKEKDYVHLLMNKFSKKDSDASFCICQVAEWERNYKNGNTTYDLFEEARYFRADIIILRFIENCSANDFDNALFKKEFIEFSKFLNGSGNAKIIVTSGFWKHPGDEVLKEIAKEKCFAYVDISDLGERDDMKAIGLFAHSGVANHPGDKGMETIAERIWEKI